MGRAFLQNAYPSADYELSLLNMSQSVYPTSSTKANIVLVFPPEQGGEIPGGKNQDSKRKTALSTCAIAGIAIGGAAALAAIVAVMIWLYCRKKMVEEERGYELQDTDVHTT